MLEQLIDMEDILEEIENKDDCEIYINLIEQGFKETDWDQFCNIVTNNDNNYQKMKKLEEQIHKISDKTAVSVIINYIKDKQVL